MTGPERRRRRRVAVAAASLGGCGTLAVLAASDFDGARARALAESGPRTFVAAKWCTLASAEYKRCQAAHLVCPCSPVGEPCVRLLVMYILSCWFALHEHPEMCGPDSFALTTSKGAYFCTTLRERP